MAANFHISGATVPVPAPRAVLSGEFVVVGELFGVAAYDAADGETLQLHTGGVWRELGVDAAAGTAVYHDGSALTLDDGGGANARAGVTLGDGLVRLNASF